MSLDQYLRGVRPNPDPLAPRSLVDVLGLGEPLEWRTEPAFWPRVALAQGRMRAAVALADADLPHGDRAAGKALWPFHVDAQGGEVAVEWWGDLRRPVRVPVVYGDEAAELVARFARDPAGPRQRHAVQRSGLQNWFEAPDTVTLLASLERLVEPPDAVVRAALLAARAVAPAASPGAEALLDDLADSARPEGGARDEALAESLRRRALGLTTEDDRTRNMENSPTRQPSWIVASAVRAALWAENPGTAYQAYRQAEDALRVAPKVMGPAIDYARLLRRLVPFPGLVARALDREAPVVPRSVAAVPTTEGDFLLYTPDGTYRGNGYPRPSELLVVLSGDARVRAVADFCRRTGRPALDFRCVRSVVVPEGPS